MTYPARASNIDNILPPMTYQNIPVWQHYLRGAVASLYSAIDGRTYLPSIGFYSFSKRAVKGARAVLPYALQSVAEDSDQLIWLNRGYKPLGVLPYSPWVDYNDFPHLHVARDDPSIAKLLAKCITHQDAARHFWLFDDASDPSISKRHAKRLLGLLELIDMPKGDV